MNLIKGVSETLPMLAEKYSCIFYSQGISEIQMRKLENSKLDKHFSDIFITQVKTKDRLAAYLDHHKIKIEAVTVIGNSPRYDINPAIELGISSIYIENPYTWERDKMDLLDCGPAAAVINKFEDLKNIL